jgi:hypothetical protein
MNAQNAAVTYNGNTSSGFGGAVGGSMLELSDDGTTITGTFTKGGGNFDQRLVIYFDTGAPGRNVIDADVNDDGGGGDALRRAVSNINAGDLTLPTGFEASFALAIDTGYAALFEIPATGTIGSNGLVFVSSGAGNPSRGNPTSVTQASFTFTIPWADLGLTNEGHFTFVAAYGNPFDSNAMFSADEGYGSITPNAGNPGFNAYSIDQSFDYPSGNQVNVISSVPNAAMDFTTVKDWNDSATWVGGVVPSSTDYVIITQGSQVGISTSVNIDNRILIESPAALGVNVGTLNLNGTISGQGAGVNQSGLGFFNNVLDPTGAQTGYRFAQFTNTENALIEDDVRVGSALYIPAQSGNGVTRGVGNTGRAFRFISSPITSTTPIEDNWQVNPLDASFQQARPGSTLGTHITGSSTGDDGFDQTPTGAPSMFFFDSGVANDWAPIANTDTDNVNAGTAYRILIRGDRNYNLLDPTAPAPNNDVWLQTSGDLVLTDGGSFSGLNEAVNQFSFIGNPYQATMDFSLFDFVNLNSNFLWVWNPNLNTNGDYEEIDLRSAPDGDPNDIRRFIKPWQSFFVQTVSNGPAAIGIRAEDKATGENESIQLFSVAPGIKMTLSILENGVQTSINKLKIGFSGDNSFINTEDAMKLQGPNEALSRNLSGTLLAIESRNQPVAGEILPLSLTGMRTLNYQFDLDVSQLPTGIEAVLVDAVGNVETVLQDGMNTVAFSADINNPNEIDPNRFSIKFRNQTLSVDRIDAAAFSVYPNPAANGSFNIAGDFTGSQATASVYNVTGQLVKTVELRNTISNISTSDLNTGVYLIKVENNGASKTQKLVIR